MEFLWRSPDDNIFPCERWEPAGEPCAILFCVHGLSGAAEGFAPLGEAAAQAGYATYAVNMRGQGNDPVVSRRGAQLDLAVLEADLSAFAQEMAARFPSRPVYWCGESMGALIVAHLLASPRFSQRVNGAIFSVPVVELSRPTPALVRHVLRLLALLAPDLRFSPAWFVSGKKDPLVITRDEEHSRRIRAAAHFIPVFTFRFLNALGNLMEASRTLAAGIRVPSLVLTAGCDVFLRPDQIEAWFQCLAAEDKELKLYPEAYHLLWNDWDREQVLADILQWLDLRVSRAVSI